MSLLIVSISLVEMSVEALIIGTGLITSSSIVVLAFGGDFKGELVLDFFKGEFTLFVLIGSMLSVLSFFLLGLWRLSFEDLR